MLKPDSIQFLTEEECLEVNRQLCELKRFWEARSLDGTFYTMGIPAYMDAAKSFDRYRAKAHLMNPLMRESFSCIYDGLINRLTTALGSPVNYTREFSLPGFHIFLANKKYEKAWASAHFDRQYLFLRLNPEEVDLDKTISFTLPIVLPSSGGGLNYWELDHREMVESSLTSAAELANMREMRFHAYQPGHIEIHSGHLYHQIAPMIDVQPSDMRITLQGHGFWRKGVWYLYW